MTKTNNTVLTISGIKDDGKTTLGAYYLEIIGKPSIIIDVTEQFEENRKYKKIIRGIQALRYELMNNKALFRKAKMQLIFRPASDNKRAEIEEVCKFILDQKIFNICVFFDEIEVYANNKLKDNSALFELYYLSRNKNIDIIAVCKIFGMLSQIIKQQTDYFALSNIDDLPSFRYLNDRSFKRFEKEIKDIGKNQFLITDLKKYWRKQKLKISTVKTLQK